MELHEIGVTPRKEAQFKKRGIESVEDLLRCYPKEYRDYRVPVSVRTLKDRQDERAAVLGIVTGCRILQGKHAMVRLKDKDGGNISAVWFNQAFRVRQVVLGGSYIVGGMARWDEQYQSVSFLMPDLFESFEGFRFGIKPVYRKIPGMSEEYFSSVMEEALSHIDDMGDYLSDEECKELDIPSTADTFRLAHLPESMEDVERAQRRVLVDNMYPFCREMEMKRMQAAAESPFVPLAAFEAMEQIRAFLLYQLTEDQKNALRRMLHEMKTGKRLDVLLQGDVGCGKTIVAIILAACMSKSERYSIGYIAIIQFTNCKQGQTFLLKGLPFLHRRNKITNISTEETTMENAQKNPQTLQEALLETLRKLAGINEVEGFDPRLLVACYKNESGEENLYLPAEPAMLWFRLKYPHGRLEQVATRVTDSMATVEGRVFDENGAMLANAFVTRYRSDTDQFGKDYVQNAGTCAIRKALGNCGFGTPATAEFIEGVTVVYDRNAAPEQPVDSGAAVKRLTPPPAPKKRKAAETVATAETAPQPEPDKPARPRDISMAEDVPPAPALAEAEKPKTAPVPPPVMKPAAQSVKAPSTLDEAMAFVVPTGRYAGKTFGQLIEEKENDAIRYFLRPLYAGKPIQQAARMVAGQYGL